MHFNTKSYLKINRNHTAKHTKSIYVNSYELFGASIFFDVILAYFIFVSQLFDFLLFKKIKKYLFILKIFEIIYGIG